VTYEDKLNDAIKLLGEVREEISDEEQARKLAFLTEQIELTAKEPNARRYSPSLLVIAAVWRTTSPALYKQIKESDMLTLPRVKHLDKLTCDLGVQTGLPETSKRYLKARIVSLLKRERLVCLMIDEVYCEKRIQFVGGNLYGAENGNYTKTLLCYMIRSVAGSYQDMVAMIPTSRIDCKKINAYFREVTSALTEIGFDIVCVSVDDHSSNKKIYQEELCDGEMRRFISSGDSSIHLLFDPVHSFKNFYTNFMNKNEFECPQFDGESISPKRKNIQDLYKLELGQG